MSNRPRDESGRFVPTITGELGPLSSTDGWDRVIVMVDTVTMGEYWRGPIEDFRESNGEDEHTSECLDRIEASDGDIAEVTGMFHLRRACHFDAERSDRGEIVSLGVLVNAGAGE
jgi:hypothetical protein